MNWQVITQAHLNLETKEMGQKHPKIQIEIVSSVQITLTRLLYAPAQAFTAKLHQLLEFRTYDIPVQIALIVAVPF